MVDVTRDEMMEEVKTRISRFVRKKIHADHKAKNLRKRQLIAIIQKITQKFSRGFSTYQDKHPAISVSDYMTKSQYKKIEKMFRKMVDRK